MMKPLAPTQSRLVVSRDGSRKIREWKIPKASVLTSPSIRSPLELQRYHPNWIASQEINESALHDCYTVKGMERSLALWVISLDQAANFTAHQRVKLCHQAERLASCEYRKIMIKSTYTEVKSKHLLSVHPNSIVGTFDAIDACFDVSVTWVSEDEALVRERVASWLSKHFTYQWLEDHQHDRCLIDYDGF